jgi:transposase
MIAIGLDVHAKHTTVAYLDVTTGQITDHRVPTSQVAHRLQAMDPAQCRVTLEVSAIGMFLARRLRSCGLDVVVVDAFKAHRVIESQNTAKTDRRDARALARLLAAGQAGALAVWVPDDNTRDLRTVTRSREALVGIATELRNQLRALLRAENQSCPYEDLTGRGGHHWMEAFIAGLSALMRAAYQALWLTLLDIKRSIAELERTIAKLAAEDETARRLMTIPGCGHVTALTVIAEIGDIARFASAAQLRSYSGLTPGIHQSGDSTRLGPLTKRGNPHLRRVMVLLAQHVSRSQALRGTRLKTAHWRVLCKHGPNPAKVDLARRLLSVIFAMLRDGTDFDAQRAA